MKVLVSDNLSKLGVAKLQEADGISVDVNVGLPKEELIKIIPNYDGLIVRSATKVTADVIEAADNLKVIGRAGVGVDNIDLDAAGKKGIIVMNAPEGNLITTAEHAMALMLSMARNIPRADATLRGGKWSPKVFMGVELYNKNLGVVGLGRIGSAVVERAKGFGMKILGYDPFISKERAEKIGVEAVELEELLKRSDFISLHAPSLSGGPLLGKKEFDIVKEGVRIVNCARGTLIDHSALIEAVKSKKVAQAALDVYEKEPLDTASPLLTVDEITCTPHLGASTGEAQDKVAIIISEQVIDYLIDGQVRNAINTPAIDGELLAKIKPYLTLGENIGKFIAQLIDGALKSVKIQYAGEVADLNTDPISVTVIKGLLEGNVEGVNMVNAPFLAKERGIEIEESKSSELGDYSSSIFVEVTGENGSRTVTGSLIGKESPRIVKIDDFSFEAEFSKNMLVMANDDKPGVIGKIGTILGNNGVNIAGFHLGRLPSNDGAKALSVINTDGCPDSKAVDDLKSIDDIIQVNSVTI